MLKRSLLWVRSIIFRGRLERDMRTEMGAHIERATERLMARGMSEFDARRAAEREFGNVVYLQEEGRLARGTGGLDALLGDVRYAGRQFARRPVITLAMVAVLALGMSISTMLFSLVHSSETMPPPGVPRTEDMVRIRAIQLTPTGGRGGRLMTYEELEQYMALTDQFRTVAGWRDMDVPLGTADDTGASHEGDATFITESYFAVSGVEPVLGRAPTAAEFGGGASLVGVISDLVWERLFARSPDVLGRSVQVNGVPVTVIGVAPPRFVGMSSPSELNVWMPLPALAQIAPGFSAEEEAYAVAARLQPGVTASAASAAVHAIAQRVDAADRSDDAERTLTSDVVPMLSVNHDVNSGKHKTQMRVVIGGLALIVLLVTCTNVSALLAGIAIGRRREVAIRLSLGAARARVLRQLLTENVLLATVAATIALAVVWLAQRIALALLPMLPLDLGLSVPATLFTFGVALTVGLLFGLSPALHATRFAVAGALRDSSSAIAGAQARLQRGLVIAQIAFTQPLVVCLAAMLMMVYTEQQQADLNEHADRIVAVRLRAASAADDAAPTPEMAESMRRLRARLAATAGIVATVPDARYGGMLNDYAAHSADRVTGSAEDMVRLAALHVPAGWLDIVGTELVAGQDFAAADTAGHTVAPVVIGDELARRLWPGANPLGRRLQHAANDAPTGETTQPRPMLTVIGVYDEKEDAEAAEDGYEVYLPPTAWQAADPTVLVRTGTAAEPLFPLMRDVIRAETPGMVLTQMRTFADMEASERRMNMLLAATLGSGGMLTLMLAAIGLYAVIALSVGQRTSEIAVRMAIGARARTIVRGFVGRGVRLGLIGLVLGLPLSMVALRTVTSIASGERPVSWALVAFIASAGVLLVVAAAAWVPALRAATVDPAGVLRRE